MKFRTAYSQRIPFPSSSGSRYRKNYVKQINENGESKLIETGVEDVYDSIQKAALGHTIDDLIRRAKSGDTAAIREPIDSYVDLSNMPTDLLSAHQQLVDAHAKYNALPSAIRSQFGNSFDNFLKASVDGSALKLLQPNKKQSDTVTPLSADEVYKIRSMIGGTNNNA